MHTHAHTCTHRHTQTHMHMHTDTHKQYRKFGRLVTHKFREAVYRAIIATVVCFFSHAI